jgi:hypothetical protein
VTFELQGFRRIPHSQSGKAKGSQFVAFNLPMGYYGNRFPNPNTGNAGDATFPKRIFLVSYGYRFAGKNGTTTDTALYQ